MICWSVLLTQNTRSRLGTTTTLSEEGIKICFPKDPFSCYFSIFSFSSRSNWYTQIAFLQRPLFWSYLFSFSICSLSPRSCPLQHTRRSSRRVPLLEENLRGQRAPGPFTGQQGDRKKTPQRAFGWREWENDTGFANGIIIERDIHLCPHQLPIQTNRAKTTLTG